MSKNSLILFLGGLIVVVSFFGIPSSWKTVIFAVLGLSVIITTALLRKDMTTGELCMHLEEDTKTDSYTQNGAFAKFQHNSTKEYEYKESGREDKNR